MPAELKKATDELSDEELDAVAGGRWCGQTHESEMACHATFEWVGGGLYDGSMGVRASFFKSLLPPCRGNQILYELLIPGIFFDLVFDS